MIWKPACLALIGIVGTGVATAAPYWIAYEGNEFPENVGWTRHSSAVGSAERSIVDGIFVLDSRANIDIFDFYEINRPLNPDAGEVFRASWRVNTLENRAGFAVPDVGVVFARDGGGTLAFQYFEDRIVSSREGWSLPIEPHVFHTYELRSVDMIHYELSIDGALAREGQWDLNSLNESFMNFGDGTQGARSFSEWDFVRFGVIPEPASWLAWAMCIASVSIAKRRI